MIAVDTNILVYAHRSEVPQHEVAWSALKAIWSAGHGWGVPWPCVHEFLAVITNPKAYRIPTPKEVAVEAVYRFRAAGARVLGESTQHLEILERLLMAGPVAGSRVHDARIAAICIGHGIDELWTADRDFSYFPELRTRNPLVSRPA